MCFVLRGIRDGHGKPFCVIGKLVVLLERVINSNWQVIGIHCFGWRVAGRGFGDFGGECSVVEVGRGGEEEVRVVSQYSAGLGQISLYLCLFGRSQRLHYGFVVFVFGDGRAKSSGVGGMAGGMEDPCVSCLVVLDG